MTDPYAEISSYCDSDDKAHECVSVNKKSSVSTVLLTGYGCDAAYYTHVHLVSHSVNLVAAAIDGGYDGAAIAGEAGCGREHINGRQSKMYMRTQPIFSDLLQKEHVHTIMICSDPEKPFRAHVTAHTVSFTLFTSRESLMQTNSR